MDPLFVDLKQANDAEANRIAGRINQLQAIIDGGYRPLTPDEGKELALLLVLSVQPVVDPLFFAVQYLFKQNFGVAINSPQGGTLAVVTSASGASTSSGAASTGGAAHAGSGAAHAGAPRSAASAPTAAPQTADPKLVQFVELYGLLETDQADPPAVTVTPAPPPLPPNGDATAWAALTATIQKTTYTLGPDQTDPSFGPFTRMSPPSAKPRRRRT